MAQSMRERDDAKLPPERARWSDAVGPGDIFDATTGWVRCQIADLCNLRPTSHREREEIPSLDLIGGLLKRLLDRVRNG
jgi:hypothetical protein